MLKIIKIIIIVLNNKLNLEVKKEKNKYKLKY